MKKLKLSVRKLVEQVMRSGDIDSRYSDSSVMLKGSNAHRRLQKSMGEHYLSEVSLSLETTIAETETILQGRADGIIYEPGGGVIIDEIKCTTMPLDIIFEQRETHIAQAKCYAYMLLSGWDRMGFDGEPPETVTVQVTYCHLETGELRRPRWDFTCEELDLFFYDLVSRYGEWIRFERDWKQTRNESIKQLEFPFPEYRAGQRELAVCAYKTIRAGRKLYAQAPTGIGKTLSTMFPSVKAIGEDIAEKIFYLTAKTVTRAVAENAVQLMQGKGLRIKSVTLRSKDKICFCSEPICNPDYCRYAKGHYDRVNDAVLDILVHKDLITPSVIEDYSERYTVCPHETALDVALWSDIIVGDYNHLFDPVAYLRRFFSDDSGDYVFLIDEAHNLADRVRDMHSAELRKSAFYRLKRDLKDKNSEARKLRKAAEGINQYLLDTRKEMEEKSVRRNGDEPLAKSATEKDITLEALTLIFLAAAEEWLAAEKYTSHPLNEDILATYFEAMAYIRSADMYDERFAQITECFESEVVCTLYCIDPAEIIKTALGRGMATVMFSATLSPLKYYREILGGDEGDSIMTLKSPFARDNLLLMAHSGISTKYADRERSYRPICEAVEAVVSAKRGNYMVFFPSYEYMRKVYVEFSGLYPGIETALQNSVMDDGERAEFLERFDESRSETLVGFCVLGGIFSEGIDLRGDRLIGTVIVGVGLPKISMRQDLIRDYFNRKNGSGYDYAYVFPGMNKVLQAAGRVIRSETDTGTALLIDSRFATPKYRALFPEHWSGMKWVRSIGGVRELTGGTPVSDDAVRRVGERLL